MKARYEHRISAPIERVLEAYASSDFYIEKCKNSGALDVEVLQWEKQEDGRIHTKARVTQPSQLPAFFRKSDVDEFVDDGVLDLDDGTLDWTITPSTSAGSARIDGKVEFHGEGDTTRVVYNVRIEVKIPLVGKKVEKYAMTQTEQETAEQAKFLQGWVQKPGA